MSPLRRKLHSVTGLLVYLIVAGLRRPLGMIGLRRIHLSLVISVLKRHDLFDRTYYLEQNEDVAVAGVPPLRHYAQYGDFEGRWPMPLFDPIYYAEHAGIKQSRRTNRLLHYLYVGRYRGISPSPWFDLGYYLSRNKDVLRAGVDPLVHFVRWGGGEGRSPSPRFDAAFYLDSNPELREWAINPLIHYLRQGQYEGRLPLPIVGSTLFELDQPTPTMPWLNDWDVLPNAVDRAAAVDVVVPVYAGAAVTLRCLHSVLRARQQTRFELTVINDASPDRDLVETLTTLASRGLFRLLHNDKNLGFVQTANRGMQLNKERDVVLLNSDTEVYGDWLDRLRAAARRNANVGTVTPLSNNATICSYPVFLQDNPYPIEIEYEELDRLASEVNRGRVVVAPTGVGFCMYVARACLDDVGLFDPEAFGRGYGEENDFCQRAIHHGWTNLVACDVFVRHWGSASFQGERANRIKGAMATMRRRHPNYHSDVKRFISVDPLAGARSRLDLARLGRLRAATNVLLVNHARGGGTERHLLEDAARLKAEKKGIYLLRPLPDGQHVSVVHPDVPSLPNLKHLALRDRSGLSELLTALGITEIHIHHLIDFDPEAGRVLLEVATEINARLRVMVHDYTSVCPRVNLVDATGVYCGEPEEKVCDRCIVMNGSDFGRTKIREWRALYRELYAGAYSVVVPDEDVAKRLTRHFRGLRVDVQPHEPRETFPVHVTQPTLAEGASLRIVVIGAISKVKGYDVLLGCARDIKKRGLPLEIVVYGYTLNDLALRREGVTITGRYLDQFADIGLAELAPHCVWLPYVWPETYSYTLSIALRYAHPVFAFDIGAIASRMHALKVDDYLMPLALAWNPTEINQRFLSFRESLLQGERVRHLSEMIGKDTLDVRGGSQLSHPVPEIGAPASGNLT
ncbi:glycosyltransferase [Methylotetracoccus oryzae]|uniref:glycosyltransferase n=1 Tax=Methylotetracoccus oryzae TaxID=1919059 RepID=UPI0011195A4B|nr:glycosyltransferase [Methylotetracoccus oryzae]